MTPETNIPELQHNSAPALQDRVAIIVGAGRGIGEAVALRFAREGARVVLAARSGDELNSVAAKIRGGNGIAVVRVTDVTNREQVHRLVQVTLNAFHRIDVLVNAAGSYGPIGPFCEADPEKWIKTFSINLFGAFHLCQAVLPHMIRARRGKIVHFSGGGATAPLPRFAAYGFSKAALVRMTETLAEEVREFNIQVNAIAPGAVDTKLQDEVLAAGARAGELHGRMLRMRETGEGATPRDLPAELAVFLCSEASRGLTGKLISAPFDGWQSWDSARFQEVMSAPWFTLRRMDPFTLKPFMAEIAAGKPSPEAVIANPGRSASTGKAVNKLRIGIIGAGRMGRIRAHSAILHPSCEVVGVADTDLRQAESLAAEAGCDATSDWTQLIRREDIDAVVVATPHKFLAPISVAAIGERKHVLCEKPGARNPAEAETVLRALHGVWPPADGAPIPRFVKESAAELVIGFTLRHHQAIARARQLLKGGEIGKPMYLIGRYGHGGRPGYEQEWRHDPDLAGGGELLDQGIHLIDLSRWLLGEFAEVTGFVGNYFWGMRGGAASGGVEDNAFLQLRSAQGRVASLQASWTQWKNLFSLEVYGESGFLEVQGLGGSYGDEKLVVGHCRPRGGAPDTCAINLDTAKSLDSQGDVWAREWHAFVAEVMDRGNSESCPPGAEPATAVDAWQALRVVDAAYLASRNSSREFHSGARRQNARANRSSPQRRGQQ